MLEIMLKKINKSKNQKGFTLVELIVVIAILGILAAVAVGRFGGITKSAKENADYATAATIASAAEVYMAQNPTVVPSTIKMTTIDSSGAKLLPNAADTYKSQSTGGKVFVLDVTDNGDVTVTDGTVTFFPKPEVIQKD